MSPRPRRPLLLVALLPLQLVALAGVLVAGTEIASAHADVVTTDPADGTSVGASPERVSVTFTESVTIGAGGLVVRDGRGQRVDVGPSSATGAVLTVDLRPDLPDGTYVGTYRVLSADDHPVSGSFLFGVGSGEIDRSLGGVGDDRTWESIGDLSRIVLLMAALLAAGCAFFCAFVHDGDDDRWRLIPFVRIGSIVAFLAAIGAVMAQAAILTGRGAGASTDTSVLREVLAGDLGTSLAVLFVGLVVVHLSTDVTKPAVAKALALYGGLAVTVSFALWGHATAFDPPWLLMAADAVHATAAAVWFGGLVGLSIVLVRTDPDAVGSTAAIVGRFSRIAGWTIVALLAAGFGLTLAGSDASWPALVATTWGRLVLLKGALTASILGLALWNRRSLVPSITGGERNGPADAERDRRRLGRAVRIEALVIVGVLAITGLLTSATPARTAGAGPTDVTQSRPVDTGTLTLSVRPARVGTNTLEAAYRDATGQPVDVANTMNVEFSLPIEGLAPLVRQTTAVAPGRFVYEGRELSMPGIWTVTLAVRRTGYFAEQRTSFEVRVEP